jgi:signal transduction histidine kinase
MGALIVLVLSLGSWETLRRGLAGLGFMVALMVVENVANGDGGDLGFLLIMLGASWVVGRAVRARRLQVEELGALTGRLEREREAVGGLAVAAERARVARDLHDAVAGLLNVMVVQATVAERCLEADPERAAAAVEAVAASGREAARELARMLELLGGASALLEPQPSLSRLDDLVGFARSAGVPVSLSVDGAARALPAGLELSAYRIVQEALTNVVKHAGGAPTEVRLRYRPSSLEIEVRDAGAASRNGNGLGGGGGGGHGLANMRERAALFGGSLLAEPSGSGGYVVRASLPVS